MWHKVLLSRKVNAPLGFIILKSILFKVGSILLANLLLEKTVLIYVHSDIKNNGNIFATSYEHIFSSVIGSSLDGWLVASAPGKVPTNRC